MASPAERLRMYRDSAVGGGSVAQRRLSELARGDAARTPGSYLQQHIERRSILADAAGAEAKAPLAKPAPSGDADGGTISWNCSLFGDPHAKRVQKQVTAYDDV